MGHWGTCLSKLRMNPTGILRERAWAQWRNEGLWRPGPVDVILPPFPYKRCPGYNPRQIPKLHMHAGEFHPIFNTKTNTMKVKFFAWKH
jgi:hypothetical protein